MNDRPKRSTRPALPAPPPASSDPRSHRRDLIQTAPDLPSPRSRPSPAPASQQAAAVDSVSSRREIKTVPGGGLNRISDGRAAASAYVGVKSLGEPVRPANVTRSPVKLAQDLLVENKEFRTEPALRSMSLPPPPASSRVTPVSSGRRTLIQRRGSPQAVVAVVAMLAVTVGVLVVVATGGGRWILPRASVGSTAAAAEVQWDHGIDGQPGVLTEPADAAPQVDPAAGQSADVGPSARSAEPPKQESTPSSVTSRSATSHSVTSHSVTSRSDTSERSKVDSEHETAVGSAAAAPAPQKPRPSTRTPSEPEPPAASPPAPSQPERGPPQPWLE